MRDKIIILSAEEYHIKGIQNVLIASGLSPDKSCENYYPHLSRNIFYQRQNRSIYTLVAVVDSTNEVVGTASFIIEPKYLRNGSCYVCHIEDVAVKPDFQNLGIGKILIEEIKRRSWYCYKSILDCKPELESFYEKLGFKKIDTINMRLDRE